MESIEIKELVEQITRTRGLDREFVINSLRESFIFAIRRVYRDPNYPIEVEIDGKTGKIEINVEKEVVKEVFDPRYQIEVENAKEYYPFPVPGIKIKVPIDLKSEIGRSVILRMKQIFLQKIQEAEKQHIYKGFEDRIGEIITGMVQKVDKTGIYVGLGKVEGFLPPEEQIKKEKYRPGQNIKALIIEVETKGKRPFVKLSRTHPNFLKELMKMEIPELMEGLIEIKGIARFPGERAKVAVHSKDEKIDPLGACVGIKGTRIQVITKELSGEKIDIIKWDPDILTFAARALSPAHPMNVFESEEKIIAIVPDEEIKVAKGTASQNVLLASALVGKEIWVVSQSEYVGKKKISIEKLKLDEEIKASLLKEVDGVFSIEELIGRIKSSKLISEEEIERIIKENKEVFE
ncbi:MAG: transcription termination factor NusA [candidate division WOR-3 bacterium]|uniref:Transcription termination/antitermination protein NusA n=1 Tax=candidate division WOR-3 bacterium TaxID=2052148 RepID=A0A7V4E1A7_UNCW3